MGGNNGRRNTAYVIGPTPVFNPCDTCIVQMCCSKKCSSMIIYEKTYKRPEKITLKRRKKKKVSK